MTRLWLGIVAANVMLAALGAGVLLAAGAWQRLSWSARTALSGFTGIAAFIAFGPLVLYAGGAPTPATLALLAAAALALGVALERRRRPRLRAELGGGVVAALLAAPALVLLALQAGAKRPAELDWQTHWGLKAKMLWGHGGHLLGALDPHLFDAAYASSHREYPLGLPALLALDFHFLGSPDTTFVQLQFVVLLAGFLATVWCLLRPCCGALSLTLGVAITAAAPGLQPRMLFAPWDVAVGCVWTAGVLALARWLDDDEPYLAVLAAVYLAAALATKIEGLVFCAVAFTVAAGGVLLARRPRRLRALAAVGSAVALTALPWQTSVHEHGVHSQTVRVSVARMVDQVGDLHFIGAKLWPQLVASSWMWALPLSAAAAVVLLLRRRDTRLALGFLATTAGVVLGLVFLYWNHIRPLPHLVNTSVSRTISAPQVLALAALPLLLERALGGVSVPMPASLQRRLNRRAGPPGRQTAAPEARAAPPLGSG